MNHVDQPEAGTLCALPGGKNETPNVRPKCPPQSMHPPTNLVPTVYGE